MIFKTPHHADFKRDHSYRIVDVAMATSAAPAYFPRHCFNNSQYVDGGLYANAPGLLGLHEANKFFDQDIEKVRLMAVGTMSSRFTVDPRQNRDGGVRDWGGGWPIKMSRRLFGLSISAQEVLSDFMLVHRLGKHYVHVDDELHDERARAVALDVADQKRSRSPAGRSHPSLQDMHQQARIQNLLGALALQAGLLLRRERARLRP